MPDSTRAQRERRPQVVVATWFYDEQPGFLDFKYRIRALCECCEVTLLLRSERFVGEFADLPLRTVVLPKPLTNKQALLRFCGEVAARARRERPDLLLLLGAQLAPSLLLMPRSQPSLLYWNEHPSHFFGASKPTGPKAWLARQLVRLCFGAARRAWRVLPIGETLQEDLIAQGLPAERTQLMYMGVDARFESSRPAPALESVLRVVYTGSVSPDRGRDVMIDGLALARARGVPCELTLVGAGGEELNHCKARAQALGLGSALRVLGRVPGEQIPAFLAEAHLGVCIWADKPWWRFNPPTKLFEYLVAGLPVLASDIATHTRYVRPGHNGLVFDYSAEGFARCLADAWARRGEIAGWAATARREAEPFRWQCIQPQFLATVTRAMEAGAP